MAVTKEVKQAVKEKDGYKCRQCKSPDNLTVDHIQPRSKGGSDDMSNLQTLCQRCNEDKANYIPITTRERLKALWNLPRLLEKTHNGLNDAINGQVGVLRYEIDRLARSTGNSEPSMAMKQLLASQERSLNAQSAAIEQLVKKVNALEAHLKVEFHGEHVVPDQYIKVKKK